MKTVESRVAVSDAVKRMTLRSILGAASKEYERLRKSKQAFEKKAKMRRLRTGIIKCTEMLKFAPGDTAGALLAEGADFLKKEGLTEKQRRVIYTARYALGLFTVITETGKVPDTKKRRSNTKRQPSKPMKAIAKAKKKVAPPEKESLVEEVNLEGLVDKIGSLEADLEVYRGMLATAETERDEVKERLKGARKGAAALDELLARKEAELSAQATVITTLRADVEQGEVVLGRVKGTAEDNHAVATALRADNDKLGLEAAISSGKIDKLEVRVETLQEELSTLKAEPVRKVLKAVQEELRLTTRDRNAAVEDREKFQALATERHKKLEMFEKQNGGTAEDAGLCEDVRQLAAADIDPELFKRVVLGLLS